MELHELTDEAITYILNHVSIDEYYLNKWEIEFVESVTDQWIRRRWLSDKQKLKLGEIWDRQK